MGRQGSKKRKRTRPLPKVQGDPGQLWGGLPTPWSAGENLQQWVGKAGPKAQASSFRRHPGAGLAFRIAAVAAIAAGVGAAIVAVLL